MRKSLLTLVLVAIVLTLLPTGALAHTGVKTSNPAKGDVVKTPLSELEVTFNTVIEPLSALTVTNEAGEEVPVTVETGKDSMKGVFEQPLASGTYTVKWRIIGEDGHNVDGEYAFKVERQAEETPSASTDAAADERLPDAGASDSGTEPTTSAGGDAGAATSDQEAEASGLPDASEGANSSPPASEEQTPASTDNGNAESAAAQQADSDADEMSGGSMNGSTIMWVVFGVLLLGGFIFGVVRIASKS
ncbi:copper resistance CopC family protein [Paenibacillus methanolicus]|uniref:CopC domain-containing protein n=1 Tax=Paenibacillus methanolicus TaxID=582686 RepID=A0A5S5CJI1_9BACL|nr:copper resistance CopC family protein [Paenibacillus methanolicus]TYP79057.1 hypothetical protein BCM02_101172 [Paenibacillus methanolicus]